MTGAPRGDRWASGSAALTAVAAALPAYVMRQRWYPAKSAGAPAVALWRLVPFGTQPESALAVWTMTPPGGQAIRLFVPVALFDASDGALADDARIAALPGGAIVGDALTSDGFVRDFVRALLQMTERAGVHGERTAQARALVDDAAGCWRIRRSSVEQSNTSIRIGDGAMLKIIRKLAVGIHPEVEMGRYLTPRLQPNAIPALYGWMNLEGCTLALLQAFVLNQGDGWTWVVERLQSGEPAPVASTLPWIRTLGRRTAEMHLALSVRTDDPAFAPEPATQQDWSRWTRDIVRMAQQVADALARDGALAAALGSGEAAALAERCANLAGFVAALIPSQPSEKTRHHGDYHLGQVLVRDDDVTIVDFEGEPLRPLAERRAKHAALRDVAGMLRSFDYAAAVAGKESRDPERGDAAAIRGEWLTSASAAYVEAYWHTLTKRRTAELAAATRLLRLFTVEKALYEVLYEMANRPAWAVIPLRSLMTLLDIQAADRHSRDPAPAPRPARALPQAAAGDRTDALAILAERCGIELGYRDVRGAMKTASPQTQRALLKAMGIDAGDAAAVRAALAELDRAEWEDVLPPVIVLCRTGQALGVMVTLPADTQTFTWQVALEDGTRRTETVSVAMLARGEDAQRAGDDAVRDVEDAQRGQHGRAVRQRRRLSLPADLPCGYHELTLDPGAAHAMLIVSPGRCWLPPAIERGERLWGISAQLYLLRSADNWGIGDYTDLRRLAEMLIPLGVNVLGLNPLHAMFLDDPEHASPYSPASRLLLNVLNIDVARAARLAPGFDLPKFLREGGVAARLDQCRRAPLVDYSRVAELKLQALRSVFAALRDAPESAGWCAFRESRRRNAAPLELHLLFLAMREHFSRPPASCADWRDWPPAYRDPRSPEVARFAAEHADLVEFHAWLQCVADGQLAAAAAAVAPMAIGLYRDLAVGADPSGAETWANQTAVAAGAQVGAPPDLYNPAGQDWGLPPFNPRALRAEAYQSFIELIRANMRHAGGLRIDHVMALQHLYWVPEGASPAEGAYVQYPLADLVGILALESERNRCLVVGEDLGTVPDGFRERMAAANILSYRVLFFEKEEDGFIAPSDYPHLAMAVEGSHDLPTLRAWWDAADLDLKDALQLFPHPSQAQAARAERREDRDRLIAALRAAGLPDRQLEGDVLFRAAHAFLAQTASAIALVQLDDITDESSPVNVPTTSDQHPNWRRRLALTLDELERSPRLQLAAAEFQRERGDPGARG